jgi:hypothetical protein
MLNKLESMLNQNLGNIVISRFSELGEESMHLANLDNMFAIVVPNEEECTLEISIEEYDPWSEEYFLIESKYYKTAGRAFNYIKKMLP